MRLGPPAHAVGFGLGDDPPDLALELPKLALEGGVPGLHAGPVDLLDLAQGLLPGATVYGDAPCPRIGKPTTVRTAGVIPKFTCKVFNSPWDQFVELWAPRIFYFVGNALGPYILENSDRSKLYGKIPLPNIEKMTDGEHTAGATASFDPATGQVRLSGSVEGKPGQTLEKLTHEFTHGSLAQFPEGDPFYEEGFVDYSVWVMSHAPVWEPYRDQMIEAASFNVKMRLERAMMDMSDWDRKRWAGGLYASLSRGPLVIANLKHRKMEGTFNW